MSNEMIIMIDLQNDFIEMMNDNFTNSINKLCKYVKLLKKNILFIKSYYFELDIDKINLNVDFNQNRLEQTHMGKKICIKNTFGSELIDIIKQYSNKSNTIIKHYYSSFKETELDQYLKKNNIDTLVFCGLTINTCVKATILDAIKLGYKIKIIKDCVTGINDKMTKKGLDELQLFYDVQLVNLDIFTNGFEIYCSGDTFIVNDIFPPDIYNYDTFNNIINECNWSKMEIQGGQLSRLVDVQALILENDNKKLIPVYRNPSDKYIEPHKPTYLVQKMFDWLNNQIDLDGIKFNHVFLKYYKSCADGIGKHSDKTLDLGFNSYIGNLSLGSTRKMTFRSKTTSEIVNITLKSNSILFIGMETNKKWLHEVKPDLRDNLYKTTDELAFSTQRISLTFRTACTFFNTSTNKLEGQGSPKKIIETDNTDNTNNTDNIYIEKLKLDKQNLIKAFGQENKRADFNWNEFYSDGFYSMCTK